jgi:uncharacterized surface protein with fasciclin (FAS1) repeats
MYPSKNIIENAVNSKDHSTLVAAIDLDWHSHLARSAWKSVGGGSCKAGEGRRREGGAKDRQSNGVIHVVDTVLMPAS